MTLSDELSLSYYQPVATIDEAHRVFLVQHTENGAFFVRKQLTVYNKEVFLSLKEAPVENTPKIYEVVEEDGELTVVEEYVQGQSLAELLQEGPLAESQAVSYAFQLATILKNLHERSIVHRDLKPSNILLSADGVLKLLDFNAAKVVSENGSQDTVLLGTTGYAAPEQYGFGASNVQTDLYALGIVLNVMVTGELPMQKLTDGILRTIIEKCTQLNPKDRYESAADVIYALENLSSVFSRSPKFFPPGFRKGNALHGMVAVLGYLLLFVVANGLQVDTDSTAVLMMNRGAFLLCGLAIIFFSCNYGGVWAKMPLVKSEHLLIRLIGVLVYDSLIFLIIMIILLIATGML